MGIKMIVRLNSFYIRNLRCQEVPVGIVFRGISRNAVNQIWMYPTGGCTQGLIIILSGNTSVSR